MRIFQLTIFLIVISLLFSCSTNTNYAPVMNADSIEALPANGVYHVMPDDTLYSISWRFGLDYRSVASRNHLLSPYTIHTGQIIYLKGQAPGPVKQIIISRAPAAQAVSKKKFQYNERKMKEVEPRVSVVKWEWPARGHVIGQFTEQNKGVNISGRMRAPIYAAAAGKVVYSGSGLRSYGNLIIIKHNSTFLTAYAHNSAVFVRSDDWVKQGQKIAEMGNTGTQRVMLHIEIRRNGKPENPLVYLGK